MKKLSCASGSTQLFSHGGVDIAWGLFFETIEGILTVSYLSCLSEKPIFSLSVV